MVMPVIVSTPLTIPAESVHGMIGVLRLTPGVGGLIPGARPVQPTTAVVPGIAKKDADKPATIPGIAQKADPQLAKAVPEHGPAVLPKLPAGRPDLLPKVPEGKRPDLGAMP